MLKRLICAAAAAVLLLTGCQPKEEEVKPEDVALYPVTVNGISFPQAPQKVVSLCPQLTGLLSATGHGAALVGVSSDQEPGENQQAVGSADAPDVDAVIALQPDLLLTQQSIPSKDINRLKEAGITAVVLPVPQNFYETEAQYREICELFDGSLPAQYRELEIESGDSKAQAVFSGYEEQLKQMAKRAASGDAKSFVFLLSPDGGKIATGKTPEGNLIGIAGCNIAQSASDYQIPFEEIARQNPDFVFVPSGGTEAVQQNAETQQLEAVAGGRIIEIDLSILSSQDPVKIFALLQTVCDRIYNSQ